MHCLFSSNAPPLATRSPHRTRPRLASREQILSRQACRYHRCYDRFHHVHDFTEVLSHQMDLTDFTTGLTKQGHHRNYLYPKIKRSHDSLFSLFPFLQIIWKDVESLSLFEVLSHQAKVLRRSLISRHCCVENESGCN